ncbi:MAG TPA: endolytic transglycosylase MltG [Gammaproteobacteria bacterium]|nr:endolytic transglycosylase MltG [Gammaproteobacteria bacterium]
MRRWLLAGFLCVILLALLIIGWLSYRFFYVPISTASQPTLYIVSPGETISQLAFNLHQKDKLPDPRFFLLMAKLHGHVHSIRSGEYLLPVDITPRRLLQKINKGDVLLHKITFVEGWTFNQVMRAINANPYLQHTLQNKDPQTIMQTLGLSPENPEGMFYPDTYLFALGTKDTKILHMSYQLMQKRLQHLWSQRAANVPYQQPYEALIVASMIEKESAQAKERPLIAGVILRRLKIGMRLQIDATVIYGMGQNYSGAITRKDLQTDTPYNTYTRAGLPPTPIAMPSYTAIKAALHPQGDKALYYVAKGDGSHIFTDNLQAHHNAVAAWLLPKTALSYALSRRCVSAALMLNYLKLLAGNSLSFTPFEKKGGYN